MDRPERMAVKGLPEDQMVGMMILEKEIADQCESGARSVDADSLSRVVKMALDAGEAASVDAAYELFRTYRLGVAVGREIESSPAHQAALLTIVNTGRRALLGGVHVAGVLDFPLLVPLPGFTTLAAAIEGLGGCSGAHLPSGAPTLIIGSSREPVTRNAVSLAVTFQDWRGGVIPISESRRLDEANGNILAAILAGALGVSEVFQNLRGNPMAGRRSVGLSLWAPDFPEWEIAPAGPTRMVLPSRLWLIGLGHLGQAYLWTLGLLPYRNPADVELVVQDIDRLTTANDSTSLLTSPRTLGQYKTRAMAAWAESRGFQTRIVERLFPGGIKIADDEPRLALGGVDNAEARAAYEDVGFDCVVEAGLGGGTTEYLALRVHAFPGSRTARGKWSGPPGAHATEAVDLAAYAQLVDEGMDQCGLVRLASRTVGAPFVGATAATLVIAEVLRRLNGGTALEVVDLTLRDPMKREVVKASHVSRRFNSGFTHCN